jgi:hypothetical protein
MFIPHSPDDAANLGVLAAAWVKIHQHSPDSGLLSAIFCLGEARCNGIRSQPTR